MMKRIAAVLCACSVMVTSVFCGAVLTAGATGDSRVETENAGAMSRGNNYYEVACQWNTIQNMSVSKEAVTSKVDNGWSKAANSFSLASDENFTFETRIKYAAGNNHQYFIYFGLPSQNDTTGGFSLRIQLGNAAGTSNIAIYDDAANKRLSAWKAMPVATDKTDFSIKLCFTDGKAEVLADGAEVIGATAVSNYSGGYLGLAAYKTKAEFLNPLLRTEQKHEGLKIYLVNEDFSSFPVEGHGTSTKGNLSVIASEYTNASILTEGQNQFLSLSRCGAEKADNCLLQFYDGSLTTDTYVVQFDARLDKNVPLQEKANLLIGRKSTASGAKFEYFVNVSQAGYLYCTTGALGSTTFGRLGSEKFSNIAVIIHDAACTYDVYLNGVPAVRNQSFTNKAYMGTPDEVQTMFRVALGVSAADSALLIDNFKVYTGSQVDDCKETDKTIIQQFDEEFKKLVYTDSRGTRLNCRMYLPKDYDPAKKYPMVLAMHGAGLWGADNESQLMNCFNLGVSVWQNREKYGECIILVPQTAERVSWVTGDGTYPWYEEGSHNYSIESFEISRYLSAVTELLDDVCSSYSVDESRQYVGGFSMGGYATWYLIMAYPERFAAAVPCCGGSDPSYAKYIKDVPIWTFHSADDATVKVEATREMVSALRALGSSVRYTEFSNLGHNVWDYAFQSDEVLDWMFTQRNETVSNRCVLRENVVWRAYTPEWLTLTTNWRQEQGVYQATGRLGWNKAVLKQKLDAGSFRFETEVTDFSGDQMYFYFGLPDNTSTDNGYSLRFQLGESAGDNNMCIYQDATKKRMTAWTAFPAGSDRKRFKLTVEMSGKCLTVLIDDKIVLTSGYLDYIGGYLGLATNKATANYANTRIWLKGKSGENDKPGDEDREPGKVWYTKNPSYAEITGNWTHVKNGLSSKGNEGWSKAGFGTKLLDEEFIFETHVSEFGGEEKQLFLYLGLTSRYYLENGYSLRVQFGGGAGNKNVALYDDVAKKRLSAWVAWPTDVNNADFYLKIIYKEGRLYAYADDVLLLICELPDFHGGYCGIATYKSGAVIRDTSVSTLRDITQIADETYQKSNIQWKFLTQSWENIRRGLYAMNIAGWNKAISTSTVKGDFFYEMDVAYVSGSYRQYYFYFGLPDGDKLENGYSIRLQLDGSTGSNNIAIYRDSDNKRVSSWMPFPMEADRDMFRLGVKLSDGVAVVYIDGKVVCTSIPLEGRMNGYLGLAANRTSAKLENQSFHCLVNSPSTGDETKAVCYLTLTILSLLLILFCARKKPRKYRKETIL